MNYELNVISHHKDFNGKSLKQYYVEGVNTIGAYGDEPFSIVFKNNTYQKVQVKISLDGTDILTGELASTKVSNKMWVVNGYSSLTLQAFSETDNGGAGFVFTSANNSVAVHTHGDLSSRGIIAAAVYTEGHVEPIKINPWPIVVDHHHHYYGRRSTSTYPIWGGMWSSSIIPAQGIINNTGNLNGQMSVQNNCTFSASAAGESYLCNEISDSDPGPAAAGTRSLESLASVGAGQYTDQKINYVTGLIKPVLAETVRVRYMWYDDLVKALRANNVPAAQPSGFPGDKSRGINLGKTPRIGNFQQPIFPRESSYERVW